MKLNWKVYVAIAGILVLVYFVLQDSPVVESEGDAPASDGISAAVGGGVAGTIASSSVGIATTIGNAIGNVASIPYNAVANLIESWFK